KCAGIDDQLVKLARRKPQGGELAERFQRQAPLADHCRRGDVRFQAPLTNELGPARHDASDYAAILPACRVANRALYRRSPSELRSFLAEPRLVDFPAASQWQLLLAPEPEVPRHL